MQRNFNRRDTIKRHCFLWLNKWWLRLLFYLARVISAGFISLKQSAGSFLFLFFRTVLVFFVIIFFVFDFCKDQFEAFSHPFLPLALISLLFGLSLGRFSPTRLFQLFVIIFFLARRTKFHRFLLE